MLASATMVHLSPLESLNVDLSFKRWDFKVTAGFPSPDFLDVPLLQEQSNIVNDSSIAIETRLNFMLVRFSLSL
jgi:hypothetical protein